MDTNQITQLLSDPKARQVVQALLNKISGGKGNGDINALVNQLSSKGLQPQVQSWISTQKNQPINAKDLQNALGADTVNQVAKQAGVSNQEAANQLAKALPNLVDKASPNGQLASASPNRQQQQAQQGQEQRPQRQQQTYAKASGGKR